MSKLRLWSNHTFLSETRNLRNAKTMLLSARRAKRTQTAAVHLQRRCTRIETQCPAETCQHHPGSWLHMQLFDRKFYQQPEPRGRWPFYVPRANGVCPLQVYHRGKCTTVIRMRALACEEPPAQAHGAGKRQASEIGGGALTFCPCSAPLSRKARPNAL